MALEKITDENYDSFIGSGKSILFLGGDWCGDCKDYFPRIQAVTNQAIQEGIKVGKVNTVSAKTEIPQEISGIMKYHPQGVGRVPRVEFYDEGHNVLSFSESPHAENLTEKYLREQIKEYFGVDLTSMQ